MYLIIRAITIILIQFIHMPSEANNRDRIRQFNFYAIFINNFHIPGLVL